MADIFGAMMRGYGAGNDLRTQRNAEQKQSTLAALAQKAYTAPRQERQGVLGQMVGVDPEAGLAMGQQLSGDDDRRTKALVRSARMLAAAPEEARPQIYASMIPELQSLGVDGLPAQYDATVAESTQKIVEAWAGIEEDDNTPAAIRELQMLQQNPQLAELDMRRRTAGFGRPQLIQTADGYAWATPQGATPLNYGGQGQPRPQQINYQTDDGQPIPQEDHAALQAAIAASARGEEFNIPVGGAAAAIESRRVRPPEKKDDGPAPPSGFRWTAGGGLEPIQGGPADPATKTQSKGVPSEGERKAATLLQRLEGSLKQMKTAIAEKPSAASPNLRAAAARGLPFVGEMVSNSINPQERQRVEAAQLDILDAALTLGTGAAYTKEQLEGYRKAFFPQIGDSKETIADKQARLDNVIKSARIAAGRAGQSGPSEDQPRKVNSAADYNALPSGATYIAPDGTKRRKK